MIWTDVLVDNKIITSIFGNDDITLDAIQFKKILLYNDGREFVLVFDLKTFPSNPPKKWIISKYNIAQVDLTLYDISELKITGWFTDVPCDLILTRDENSIVLSTKQGSISLYIRAGYAKVTQISAYSA